MIIVKCIEVMNGCEFEYDVEVLISKIDRPYQDNDYIRKVIIEIEQGEYVNEFGFMDRFGEFLPIRNLSTGSKAAICAYYIKDRFINLVECGTNAIDFILANNEDGMFVLENRYYIVASTKDTNVSFNGFIFTKVNHLLGYISKCYPEYPTNRAIKEDTNNYTKFEDWYYYETNQVQL